MWQITATEKIISFNLRIILLCECVNLEFYIHGFTSSSTDGGAARVFALRPPKTQIESIDFIEKFAPAK
jgi:hypothetical protein